MEILNNKGKIDKTKTKIAQTVLNLMETKPIHAITISDITTQLDINRSTFYRHFIDKYDVLEKIEDEIFKKIKLFQKDVQHSVTIIQFDDQPYITTWLKFLKSFSNDIATIKILLSDNGDLRFSTKLLKLLKDLISSTIKDVNFAEDFIDKDVFIHHQASSFLTTLSFWANNPHKDIEKIFDSFYKIERYGALSLVQEKRRNQ